MSDSLELLLAFNICLVSICVVLQIMGLLAMCRPTATLTSVDKAHDVIEGEFSDVSPDENVMPDPTRLEREAELAVYRRLMREEFGG
jgi:hypothetical protein